MFTDWTEALEAESLPLEPTPAQQLAAAARVTARASRDKDDMALLLDVLGLPTDPDTLTALPPLLPESGDAPTMTTTPAAPALSAHEAMAISMHNNGDSQQTIREATGLSKSELSDLIADQVLGLPRTAVGAPAIDVPVIPLAVAVSTEVQELLAWAAAHQAASVRSRATRITADLCELSERRDSEAAQRPHPRGARRHQDVGAGQRPPGRRRGHDAQDGPGGVRRRAPGAGPQGRLTHG